MILLEDARKNGDQGIIDDRWKRTDVNAGKSPGSNVLRLIKIEVLGISSQYG